MDIETGHARPRLLLDFRDDGGGSADVELGLDAEALLENLFYSLSQLGAGRDGDDYLAFLLGRVDRLFPIEGRGWFRLTGARSSRSEQGEGGQPAETEKDFYSEVQLSCARLVVKISIA